MKKKNINGQIKVAAARDYPLVFITVPRGAREILFTPDQARDLARLLRERADEVDGRSIQQGGRYGTA